MDFRWMTRGPAPRGARPDTSAPTTHEELDEQGSHVPGEVAFSGLNPKTTAERAASMQADLQAVVLATAQRRGQSPPAPPEPAAAPVAAPEPVEALTAEDIADAVLLGMERARLLAAARGAR